MTSSTQLSMADRAKIAWARLYHMMGWPGVLGLLMAITALALAIWLHYQPMPEIAKLASSIKVENTTGETQEPTRANSTVRPELPRAEQQVDILIRIKAQVLSAGLTWPKADYKLVRLSDENLAHLEVHTTLKGPYPKLRQLITTLLNKEPALALRELSLQRPNADTPDVEAKIQFVVFLGDDWPPVNEAVAP